LLIVVVAWRAWDEPMTANNEQIRAAIAEQAGEWFAEENLAGPLDPERCADFMAWVKASPVHVEEYLAIGLLTRDLVDAADDPRLELESVLAEARSVGADVVTLGRPMRTRAPDSASRSTWRARPRAAVAVAAAAALVILAVSVVGSMRDGERFGLPRTYSTAHGEQTAQRLPDGSLLHLNTDSQVTVHYSRQERVVDVDHGQALFQVTHDGERQFRVSVTGAQVVAVGTQFDVYRRPDTVVVTVIDGAVAVSAEVQLAEPTAGLLPERAVRLGAGYQLEVSDRRIGLPRSVDARSAIAWLQRKIVFENRPLSEVADEFNRYGSAAIEIDDASLRAQPISGAFDADDTDAFAAFLESLDGIVVQRTPNRIRVVSVPPGRQKPPPVTR
jgi:transmembrane sensor